MELQNVNFGSSKNERKTANVKESLAAATAAQMVPMVSLTALPAINKMSKLSTGLAKDEIEIVNKVAEQIVDNTGLRKKGLEIIDYGGSSAVASGFSEKLMELVNPLIGTANGKNAFFTDKPLKAMGEIIFDKNKVVINKEKLSLAVFHELGHAFNNNLSKGWKIVQKMRMPGIMIASGLALFSAFSKKSKPEEGKELTKFQKVKNSVRDKSGLLAFTALVPMLLEEGMASIRGCKWAKQLLSPELAKKVKSTNLVAYTSYLATVAGLSLAAFAATKIKDKLVAKKEAKLAEAQ